MSQQLIAHNPDLKRLRDEGCDVAILGGYLLIRNVPYVDANRTVQRGILSSPLELSGDKTVKPSNHVAQWTGEHPCHSDGTIIRAIQHQATNIALGDGLIANFTFSAKADYHDYYHKMTTYLSCIAGEAAVLDPTATPYIFPVIPEDHGDGVFKYVDTASSRANIGEMNHRLEGLRIGIVGLGGTGAYVLDLVAKTWVKEIHLYDGDVFSQHNAFRAPGAPTIEQLRERPQKVAYFANLYANMRNGIIPHDEFLSDANVSLLDPMDFVFLCLDQGWIKRLMVDRLVANQKPFVEVGLGVDTTDGQLGGIVGMVYSTPENRNIAAPHLRFGDDAPENNAYATNIQIAELNALNATIAVMQWKRHYGVYRDTRGASYYGYSIPSGEMVLDGLR